MFPELINDYFINNDDAIVGIIMKSIVDEKIDDGVLDSVKMRKDVKRYIIKNYDVS